MPLGRDLVDALECVLSVFFSNVRHRSRAAFLLCDELVEMVCKAKIRQTIPNLGKINFYLVLKHGAVGLDPDVPGLGQTLLASHETRNHMQHAVAAATVDDQHCADAILDAVLALEHCFPGSTSDLSLALRTAIRVVRLCSSQGNQKQRDAFDTAMRRYKWNTPYQAATGTDLPIPAGTRDTNRAE